MIFFLPRGISQVATAPSGQLNTGFITPLTIVRSLTDSTFAYVGVPSSIASSRKC